MKRAGVFFLGFLAAAPLSLIAAVIWKWLQS